ncbi:MAG: hypothetical protein Q8N84_01875, partial [bacterium]|nr:hypothetical protein [bacterium]
EEAQSRKARRAEAKPVGGGSSDYLVSCFIPPKIGSRVRESVHLTLDEWTAWWVAARKLHISVGFPPRKKNA